MGIPEDLDDRRNSIVEAWHEYGRRFRVFVPEHHPAPDPWDPEVQELDEKGRTNPQFIKHWRFFVRTREFLRDHYARYHTLEGPSLCFDCLVPKFQDRMYYRWAVDQLGDPVAFEVHEDRTWYERAVRTGLFGWEVGFSCRSVRCERHWCSLHRENPRRFHRVNNSPTRTRR